MQARPDGRYGAPSEMGAPEVGAPEVDSLLDAYAGLALDQRLVRTWVSTMFRFLSLFLPLFDSRPDELALERWEGEGGPPAP